MRFVKQTTTPNSCMKETTKNALFSVVHYTTEPTDDSVEIAVNFVKEVGQLLEELSPQGLHAIFERFRGILHEGDIDKRVQYTIEGRSL